MSGSLQRELVISPTCITASAPPAFAFQSFANMHNIPLEILEAILLNLAHTHQINERFSALTPTSRRSILSARLVWGAYRTTKPLRQLFVQVLEETPFVVTNHKDARGRISGLDAISRSEYARDLTTLSFCPMVFDNQLHAMTWPPNTFETLLTAISRFPSLKHICYFTLPPKMVKGRWVNDNGRDMYAWAPPRHQIMGEVDPSFERYSRPEMQAARYFGHLQWCFEQGGVETLTMPFGGNIGSFCAIPWSHMTIDCPMFPASLRRVSINLMIQRSAQPIFDGWLFHCPNLEYLDIALCRSPECDPDLPMDIWWTRDDFPWFPTLARPKEYALTKLTELRLAIEVGFCNTHSTFLDGLTDFPALKKLVLGQFMTFHMDWKSFLDNLGETNEWRIDLDVLWLLNPLQDDNAEEWTHPPYARYGNDATTLAAARGAAKEVRIIHKAFPWDDGVIKGVERLGEGRGFRYPSFDVFEEQDVNEGR
jgi:hypothetical protein